MEAFVYRGDKAREISFPLGGIGTGCIGLAGNGRLIDPEIMGRPNKGSHAGFTHFAIKAEQDGKVADARVLNGDLPAPYTGAPNRPHFNSYGFGPDRASMAGFPHFRNCTFQGTFPIAALAFSDEHFPGQITMRAFNPFIPLNDRDSTIPGAFFLFEITNNTGEDLDYTLAFSASNLYSVKNGRHSWKEADSMSSLTLAGEKGDKSLCTDGEYISRQLYWYRGNWFDNLSTFWKDFTAPGPLKDRDYSGTDNVFDGYTNQDVATLAAHLTVKAGETGVLRFLLTWNTPQCSNYWNPGSCGGQTPKTWKHYYATLFGDSAASAAYGMREFGRLWRETLRFRDILFGSSLPHEVLDAVSANLSVIKSPTCLRLEDGSLYGFEGCHCDSGCCEGSCTHVWSYTYVIPFLFPALERSMRTLEYTYSMRPDGGMSFRLMLPVGREPDAFRPCVDGQYGTVLRVLREYRISGDREWLASIWPQVKRSIEFAWSPENLDRWDADKDGVMEGRQHHTLDMELFGKNAWLTGMYLAGLKAGAELARIMEEPETAAEYEGLFRSGKAYLNDVLFNGEYFFQKVDLRDKSQLEPYAGGTQSLQGHNVYDAYWNEEQGQVSYQVGEGCGLDQVLAQWHANLIGLGEVFEQDKVRSALGAIYRHNFLHSAREHANPCRLYCLNDESGLLICSYPEGRERPAIPIPYAEETMHGFEYQAACHMIQEGMVEEGLRCVRAVRDRYDGERRNPWNEFECGSNYARSMASYALLLTYSGFQYDLARGMIGFTPLERRERQQFLWSLDSGWGQVAFSPGKVVISLESGKLELCTIHIGGYPAEPKAVLFDGTPVAFRLVKNSVQLEHTACAKERITLQYE